MSTHSSTMNHAKHSISSDKPAVSILPKSKPKKKVKQAPPQALIIPATKFSNIPQRTNQPINNNDSENKALNKSINNTLSSGVSVLNQKNHSKAVSQSNSTNGSNSNAPIKKNGSILKNLNSINKAQPSAEVFSNANHKNPDKALPQTKVTNEPIINKNADSKSQSGNLISIKMPSWVDKFNASSILESFALSEGEKWYSSLSTASNDSLKIEDISITSAIKAKITNAIEAEIIKFKKSASKQSSDEKWVNDVIKSGTLSDKIAALTLKVQANPILETEALDQLVYLTLRKEQRPAQLALEAVKDLLIHNLLPDKHLRPFQEQPLKDGNISSKVAILMWFEDFLCDRVKRVIEALENGLKSTVIHFKRSSMDVVKDLLISKPEQEGKLLSMLVNKLGDPSTKVSSHSIELLKSVIKQHPVMRSVITREVRQFISHPSISPKIIYIGVLFLTQMPLSVSGVSSTDLAVQLVDTYVSLFTRAIKQEELKSKLLSVLLTGINRAFPYLKDKQAIISHIDALFQLVHDSSFAAATQALVLISYIALGKDSGSVKKASKESAEGSDIVSRYYRALYSSLASDSVLAKSHNTVFLNLLFRSMKRDSDSNRIAAFVKRIMVCTTQSSAPVAAGLLLLVSEIIKSKPELVKLLFSNEINTTKIQEEMLSKSNILGSFDIAKRDPSYAISGPIEFWEIALLNNHYHPSVQAFTKSLFDLSKNHVIEYSSDPTLDFSTIAFLNKFAYKNPKKKNLSSDQTDKSTSLAATHKRHASSIVDDLPVNSSEFLESDPLKIEPEKQFFHKFFFSREKLRETGKVKERKKRKDKEDLGVDSDDDFEDFEDDDGAGGGKKKKQISSKRDNLEDEIDDYADKLAEDMMKNADEEADLDDEDFSEDEDDDLVDVEGGEGDDFEELDENDDDDDDDDDDSSFGGQDLDEFEDDDMIGNRRGPESDDSDDGYEIMEYGDEGDAEVVEHSEEEEEVQPLKKGKRKNKESKSVSKKSKKDDSLSDFADAADYEDEMEDILRQIRETQQGESSTKKAKAKGSKPDKKAKSKK